MNGGGGRNGRNGATGRIDHRAQLGRGFNWLGGATVVARLADLLTTLAMLLLLPRQQVGTASLVISLGMIVEALNGLGIGVALIQARALTRLQCDTAFWYALGVGGTTGALLLLGATPIRALYGVPGLAILLVAVAAKQPLVGAAVVPVALMNRDLQYRQLALVNVAASVAAAATRLALGLAGTGAWALVGGYVSSGLFTTVGASIARRYRPRFRFRRSALAGLARFGVRAALADASEQVFKNVDFLLIGWFYGPGTLAVYKVAFDVAMEPATAIGTLVGRTALPVLARVAGGAGDLTAVLAWCLRRIALLVAPLAAALTLAALPLTALLHDGHGHSYAAAGAPLRLLAPASVLRVLFNPFSTALLGVGHPGAAAGLSLLTLGVLVGGISAAGSTLPAAAGLLATSALWLAIYPLLLLGAVPLLRRREPVAIGPLFRALRAPALGTVGVVAAVVAIDRAVPGTGPWFRVAVAALAASACTAVLVARDRRRARRSTRQAATDAVAPARVCLPR